MEELKKWFFSFGHGHVSPAGYPLHLEGAPSNDEEGSDAEF